MSVGCKGLRGGVAKGLGVLLKGWGGGGVIKSRSSNFTFKSNKNDCFGVIFGRQFVVDNYIATLLYRRDLSYDRA